MSKIEAIIFDMGRVLVAIDNGLLVNRLFKGMAETDTQEIARRTMADPAMVDFNSGRIGPEAFFECMRRRYGLSMDFAGFATLWCDIFYTMEGMEELVAELRARYRVGLLSDTDPLHWACIRQRWPWIGAFESVTLSYRLGVMKPAPEIYRAAAEAVKTPCERCLYVDDLEENVRGAVAVGMQGVRFEGVEPLRHWLTEQALL
jgi:putative hydrolase of the HAD superfamily